MIAFFFGYQIMRLAFREFGGAGRPPLVILHGLLGSSRNWRVAGRGLSARFEAVGLDLRNHGDSPRSERSDLASMVEDVLEWLGERGHDRVHLMGHSLGGKVAMRLACRHPERVNALYVLDVAPKDYSPGSPLLDAMLRVDLSRVATRRDVDRALESDIPDSATRGFLLTNLVHRESSFRWRSNLPALHASLADLRKAPLEEEDRFTGPTLFLVGGRSTFFTEADIPQVLHHFPSAIVTVLEDSGHNVHFDSREEFIEQVLRFAVQLGP